MHWILQENIFNEAAFNVLIDTLHRYKIPYSQHKVIPFIGELLPPPPIPDGAKAICIGSYSMRHSAKVHGWTPGVFDLQPTPFDVQLKHWGDNMFNADSVVTRFKDAHWEDGGFRFIRPCDDSKHFAGGVFEWDEFRDWQKNVCILNLDYGNSLTPDTMIQVAQPKKIYAEYRCWVVDGCIVTCSLYKRGSTVIYQNMDGILGADVRGFANKLLLDINFQPHGWLPRAYCIDVCDTPDGWKIMEINTINSCGFYAADISKLVLALDNL